MASDFAPSVEEERRAGVRVVRMPFPPGVGGVRLSLEQIAQRIREGGKSPKVMGWAMDQLLAAGIDGRSARDSAVRKMSVLLDAVRSATVYTPDPPNAELVKSAEAMLCLAPGLCVRGGDCFPEGTLLLRDDYTFVPIEEIDVGERIWGKDAWTTVTAKRFKGRLAVDAVEMNNGSTMHLTAGHKVYVGRCRHSRGANCPTCPPSQRRESFERVKLSDLVEGETLLQPERVAFGETVMDPRRAYVEGLELADGWTEDNRFCVAGRDGKPKEAQKHEVVRLCAEMGIETSWHPRYVRVLDAEWAARLAKLGKRARLKGAATIGLTSDAAHELLRGLMADSTANTHGGGRTYSTTSRLLMLQVRVLHRMFGRSCSVHFLTPEQHGGAGKHPLWRLGVRSESAAKVEKALTVKTIERGVRTARCWDISTEDRYVYLPEHDVTVSNCDDMVILLGSVLMSVGIPVLVIKQTFSAQDQEHVLIRAQDDFGNWIPLDPSTNLPAGQCASARQEFAVDPLNPDMIGLTGVPEAEFVGIGALPALGGPRRLGAPRMRLRPRTVGRPGRRLGDAVTDPMTGQVVGDDGNPLPTDANSVLQIPEATIVGTPPAAMPEVLLWAIGLGAALGLFWELREARAR